jgi:L-ribulose-5-phosphate 4-epimerase
MLHKQLREEVCAMNLQLPKSRLVVWTGGNVSGIARDAGHVVIKPSGVPFDDLKPEDIVVVDMKDGTVIEGDLKPSVDTLTHLYIYAHRPEIGGIAHTHSPYATSFAALGRPIPAALTPMIHLLGSDVPCTSYVQPGDVETGRAIVEVCPEGFAALAKQHGLFTMGATPTDAVKVAVTVEEAAQTIHLALQMGEIEQIPPGEIERSFAFYRSEYGQGYNR